MDGTGDEAPRGDLEFATTPRLVRQAGARAPEAEAVVDVDAGVTLTYEALADAVLDAARAYTANGVQPGDRVGVWAPNIWEWIVGALGAQSAGAILVPLNTRFKGAEAAYVLRKSGARALATVNGFLGTDYLSMLDGHDLPDLTTRIVLRGDVPSGAIGWSDFVASGEKIDREAALETAMAVEPDD